MPNKTYPSLTCKGYNKENCTAVVINKKHCLCNNCYSRYYYDNILDENKKTEYKAMKIHRYNLSKIKNILENTEPSL